MNQIPNIEETHNTREVEEFYKKIDDYYRENFDESQPRKKMYITELLHQQRQKARHDWLREEIIKLEEWLEKGTHMVDCPISHIHLEVSSCTCGAFNGGKNYALQTIIDRYKEELDQDKK